MMAQTGALMQFVHRRRRGAELFLLVLALVVGVGAYAAVGLGLNLVSVRSGAVELGEPFTDIAKPDDQFDGELRHGLGSYRPPEYGYLPNLTVPDRLDVRVHDPYDNPLSNFSVLVRYVPDPQPAFLPPGFSRLREVTTTPGTILTLPAYVKCIETHPSVSQGECEGEVAEAIQKSSPQGAFFYPVLGDSPFSVYLYAIGTPITPDVLGVRFLTAGGCRSGGLHHHPGRPASPARCRAGRGRPWPIPSATSSRPIRRRVPPRSASRSTSSTKA